MDRRGGVPFWLLNWYPKIQFSHKNPTQKCILQDFKLAKEYWRESLVLYLMNYFQIIFLIFSQKKVKNSKICQHECNNTLHKLCAVRGRMCSTSEDVQYGSGTS